MGMACRRLGWASIWEKCPKSHLLSPTEAELHAFQRRSVLTIGDIVTMVKVNWEKTDPTGRSMSAIMSKATKHNKFLWSYVLSRCSGRKFAEKAAGGKVQGDSVRSILAWAWDQVDDPKDLCSAGFQPQTRYRETVKGMTKEQFLKPEVLQKDFDISLRPTRVRMKTAAGKWRRKKYIKRDFKKLRGNGPFLAKHMWRIFNSLRKPLLPDDDTYSDSGSGSRAFLLLEQGLPQRFGITCSSQSACDTFNVYLQRFIQKLAKLLDKMIKNSTCERELHWLMVMKGELLDCPESSQFVCCEGIKVLRFIVDRHSMYLYHKCKSSEQHVSSM